MNSNDEANPLGDEAALGLSPQDLAVTRILRAAFAVLDLEGGLDPGVGTQVKGLPDLVAASRRVIDELGFGDAPQREATWGGPGRHGDPARRSVAANERPAR